MGIKNLYKFIASRVPQAVEQVVDREAAFRGKRAAVDIMMLLYRLVAQGDKYLEEEARLRFRSFMDAGMEPILIQDGAPRIYKEQHEHVRRKEEQADRRQRLQTAREDLEHYRECAAALLLQGDREGACETMDEETYEGTYEGTREELSTTTASASAWSTASQVSRTAGSNDLFAEADAAAAMAVRAAAATRDAMVDSVAAASREDATAASEASIGADHDSICVALALKEGDVKRAAKADLRPTKEQLRRILDVAADMGIRIHVAQHDGEELAAVMNAVGDVDYVITEDQDALPFGAPAMLRMWWDTGRVGEVERQPVIVHLERALAGLDLDMPTFRDFCILCGCDFAPKLKYMGTTTAYKLMQHYGTLEAVCDALEDWARGRLSKKDVFLRGPDDQLPTLQQLRDFRAAVPHARHVFSLADSGYDSLLREELAVGRVAQEPEAAWREREAAMLLALGGKPRPMTELLLPSAPGPAKQEAPAAPQQNAPARQLLSSRSAANKGSGAAKARNSKPAVSRVLGKPLPPAPSPVPPGDAPLTPWVPALLAIERGLQARLAPSRTLALQQYCSAVECPMTATALRRHMVTLQQLLEQCPGPWRQRWRPLVQDTLLPALAAASSAAGTKVV